MKNWLSLKKRWIVVALLIAVLTPIVIPIGARALAARQRREAPSVAINWNGSPSFRMYP